MGQSHQPAKVICALCNDPHIVYANDDFIPLQSAYVLQPPRPANVPFVRVSLREAAAGRGGVLDVWHRIISPLIYI